MLCLRVAATVAARRASFSSMAPPVVTRKYLLLYDYVPDILEKRDDHRPAHFELVQHEAKAGRLEQAGAFDNPVDGAAFVFQTNDKAQVEEFVRADPYYVAGLVTKYDIREWTVAVRATD